MIELKVYFIFSLDENDDFYCYDRMMIYSDTVRRNPRFGIPQNLIYQGTSNDTGIHEKQAD